jgi:hypothetical protein
MTVAASILVFVVGAILWLAGLETVGLVVMAVGVLGAGLGLLQQALLARRGRRPPAQPR